jgi:hypothetical protein
LAGDEEVKATVAEDAAKPAPDKLPRVEEIYIPYEKLRKVFEKEGRGVFLPYEKFQELWKAAHANAHPTTEPHPPLGAVITEIESRATVAKDVVQVTAKLKIDLLAEGWQEVPLRLGDAALTRATLGGKPARILELAGGEHQLLVEHQGKAAEQIELTLEYAKSITRTPGLNSAAFEAPQAPVNRWEVRIPQSGVKVSMRPLLAASEVPPEKDASNKVEETVLQAFVGAAPSVCIEWTPKAEGASGLAALATAEINEAVTLSEGVVHVRVGAHYTISRAELSQLSLEVPADYKVTGVVDANVRQWSVEDVPPERNTGKKVQHVVVKLFESAKQSQSFTLEMEKNTAFKRQESVQVPVVKALEVGRQAGSVFVSVDEGLRAEATKTTGVVQEATVGGFGFHYRYPSVPYDLEFSVDVVQPRITVDSLVEATLEPERLSIDTSLEYNIERAGVFKLELAVPPGFDVRRVAGAGRPGHAAVEVDSYHVEGEKKDRLVVNLARKASGPVALSVSLQRDLSEKQLREPSDAWANLPLPWTTVAAGAVQAFSGRVVIYAPESLRVNPAKSKGLRAISYDEAIRNFPPDTQAAAAGSRDRRPVLAFAFTEEPTDLQLSAQRRKPQVTIRQLLVARVDEGVIKYQDTFFYTVLYSGIKSLRVDIPAELAGVLHNVTPGIHDAAMADQPHDVAKDRIAWSLTGGSELIGEGKIDLVWESKIDNLEIGKEKPLNIPSLLPRDVDRSWGQIVLAKAETLDFREADKGVTGLRPIDPQHDLMQTVEGAARAFEFQGDWSLPVIVLRYGLEDVKRTSIDRAVVRAVTTQAGQATVQAIYRVRSVLPLLSIVLPEGAQLDSDPIRVNGQPQTPRKGAAVQTSGSGSQTARDNVLIPLVSTTADEPFVLEVRYTLPKDRAESLALPQFPDNTAVQVVYLCAVTPESDDLIGSEGQWSKGFEWMEQNGRMKPYPRGKQVPELLNWVCEGSQPARTAADSFQADGTIYYFSALSPSGDQPLKLIRVDHTYFNAWLFVAIALFGLLLLAFGWLSRILGVGLLIIVLVLLGVFLPTFAVHLDNVDFMLALLCVFVVWTLVSLVRSQAFLREAARSAASRLRPSCEAASGTKAPAEPLSPVSGVPPVPPHSDPSVPLPDPPPTPPDAAQEGNAGGEHHE